MPILDGGVARRSWLAQVVPLSGLFKTQAEFRRRVDGNAGMTTQPPIFVVGVPRSGTTLLTAMLGTHSRLDCGPETHFFSHARGKRLRRALNRREWPACGVEFLVSLGEDGSRPGGLPIVSRAEIEDFLRPQPASVRSLLDALTVPRAARAGKPRWIEKTPNHLLHLDRIRQLYPDAQIIRIVRDPRDVALSLRRVPFASRSFAANLYSYSDRDRRSYAFFERDSNSLTVRYEDLISEPRTTLANLCEFLNEGFEEQMLQPQSTAGAVISQGEWWKSNVRTAIDGSRAQVWTHELSEAEKRLASLVCGEAIARYRYPGRVIARASLSCQPLSAEFIERNESLVYELAQLGVQLHPWDPYQGSPDIVVGLPGQLRWPLGHSARSRIRVALTTAIRVVLGRLRRVPIIWIADSTHLPIRKGLSDAVCDVALRWLVPADSRKQAIAELTERVGRVLSNPEAIASHRDVGCSHDDPVSH